MRVYIPVIATILGFAALQAQAFDSAGNDSPVRTRFVVKFADLNLDNEHDAKIILKRIERAARQACGGQPAFSSYTGGLERNFYECRDAAIREAIAQLRAPLVGRVYEQAAKLHAEP